MAGGSKEGNFIKTSLKLDRELYARVKRLATMKGVSAASLINEAMRRLLEEEEREIEKERNT